MKTRVEQRKFRTEKIMKEAGITEEARCNRCDGIMHFNYNVGNPKAPYSMACPDCGFRTYHYRTAIEAYESLIK